MHINLVKLNWFYESFGDVTFIFKSANYHQTDSYLHVSLAWYFSKKIKYVEFNKFYLVYHLVNCLKIL